MTNKTKIILERQFIWIAHSGWWECRTTTGRLWVFDYGEPNAEGRFIAGLIRQGDFYAFQTCRGRSEELAILELQATLEKFSKLEPAQ